MGKYVSVDELKRRIAAEVEKDGNHVAAAMGKWVCAVADEMPAADVAEERLGQWVRREDEITYWYECSICHNDPPRNNYGHEYFSLYCPACGAKMDGKGETE